MTFSILNAHAAWRTTIQNLRQDFRESAEMFPNLQHAILQALDDEGAIPPSFQREMRDAGGRSEGELRARWEHTKTAKGSRQSSYLDWLALNCPAKRSYLFGERAGRERFEFLANQAWLALPGTVDGKAQAYPQLRMIERWIAFVYRQLQTAPSYLAW